ncbi:hypothetical protein CQ034_12120 [Microbacterium sp. MYb45]|nr:hypothetical protein CQ034_12120 [Microbacterium sp. MYb45]
MASSSSSMRRSTGAVKRSGAVSPSRTVTPPMMAVRPAATPARIASGEASSAATQVVGVPGPTP